MLLLLLLLVPVLGLFDVEQPASRLFGIGSLANANEITTMGIGRVGILSGHVKAIADLVQNFPLKGRLRSSRNGPVRLLLLLLQLLRLLTDVTQCGRDHHRVVRTTNVHVRVLGLLFEKVDQGLFQFQQTQSFAGISEGRHEGRFDHVYRSRRR